MNELQKMKMSFPGFPLGVQSFFDYLTEGRSCTTETMLPRPTRSSSRVTRCAVTRGVRVRPGPSEKSTIPASCSFFSVRERFDSLRWATTAGSRSEAGCSDTISRKRLRFSSDSSFTIALGEVVAPKTCDAVASLSNQRGGVSFAVTGLLMTLFVHVMNSLIDPVL